MDNVKKILPTVLLLAVMAAVSGFDFSKHSIPVDDIISGGPGKDGIPSLTDPVFVPASEAGWMRPGDKLVGVEIDGEAKAYPVRILNWHEAVNDRLAGSAILVTW